MRCFCEGMDLVNIMLNIVTQTQELKKKKKVSPLSDFRYAMWLVHYRLLCMLYRGSPGFIQLTGSPVPWFITSLLLTSFFPNNGHSALLSEFD